MRIKELIIDGSILTFAENENIFLIRDLRDDPLADPFIEFIDTVFSHPRGGFISDCDFTPVKKIKCVCEKEGNIFEISVTRDIDDCVEKNAVGLVGNFERVCRFKLKDMPNKEKEAIISALKINFQEHLMPSALPRYYCGGITEYVEGEFDMLRTNELIATLRSETPDVIDDFVAHFTPIEFYGVTMSFDKDGDFVLSGNAFNYNELNAEQAKFARLWDFITANKLHRAVLLSQGKDGNLPIFIHGAFRKMAECDIKIFIDEFKKTRRQVFISGEDDDDIIEKYCNKVIFFNGNK